MEAPKTLKQLRGLQGRFQSIRRFIAQLADKHNPYSHLLRKGVAYQWDNKCEEAFNKIKEYMLTPLVLMPPIPRNPLILYVSAIASTLGDLLSQHDENGTKRAIYYNSRTMVGHELNYSFIEKVCLAVVFASQKFRHYMLAHKIKLIAKIDPLKYLLSKAMLTGRMENWVMILSEYDIEYVEQKVIKGQVITDQLAEAPIYLENPLISEFPDESIFNINIVDHWKLYFDGSCMQHGSGVSVFFITPQGDCIPRSYKLVFPCTNNIA